MIQKAKGYSDVTVYDDVMKQLNELEKEDPRVSYTLLFTPVQYIEGQYESSMRALVEGALLAVVVVFLFLRDWRATLISAIAIPLSAIPAFWFMDMLGFTLNMVTLLALSLVAGVLVDDAIVEIENIVQAHADGQVRLSGLDRGGRRDRPAGGRDHLLDRRGVPAGRDDGRDHRAIFISFGLTDRHRRADQPRRRAPDHADDRGLFPEGARPGQAWRRLADGQLSRPPQLDAAQPLEDGHDRRARASRPRSASS